MRVIPGALVDFYSEGEIVAGVVLSEEKGRLRVVTESGREDRIAPGRVLAIYEGNSKLALAAGRGGDPKRSEAARQLASAHGRAAREKREGLDLELVWELLVDEGGERMLEDLCELATGGRDKVARAAVLRELLEEKAHFSRRGDLWEPRPRSAVEETLRQKERERRREEERNRFLEAVRDAISGRRAFVRSGDEEEARILRLLEELAVEGSAGASSRDAVTILGQLPVSGENPAEAACRTLVALGVFSEDENLFIRRFGLKVDFPEGAEALAERAVAEALSLPAGEARTADRPGPPEESPGGAGAGGGVNGVNDEAPRAGVARPSADGSGARRASRVPLRLAEEIARGARRDLTHLELFSIDDELTSEIDDALSVEPLGPGRHRVGIHIADPGLFVLPGSELDRIAGSRAVTFYLPERRVLMLPSVISEAAAALLPGLPRPALSFFATLGDKGELLDWEIVGSVIRSRVRVTYEEADAALRKDKTEVGEGERSASQETGSVRLGILHRLALALEAARLEAGAYIIRAPDVDLRVAPDGIITLKRLEGDSAGRLLVSEMMILAGRIAALFCLERSIPCMYRRQPPPEETFSPVTSGPYDPVAVRKARRGLRRGETGLVPGRHHALGLDAYAQATSPIRRYQDLVIHRQIKCFLASGMPWCDAEALQRIAATTDEAERAARLAERGTDEYWTLKYLGQRKGQEVEGVVVYREPRRVEVELCETLYAVSIPPRPDHELGQRIRFVIESVNPRGPSIRLRQLDPG